MTFRLNSQISASGSIRKMDDQVYLNLEIWFFKGHFLDGLRWAEQDRHVCNFISYLFASVIAIENGMISSNISRPQTFLYYYIV